MKKIENKIAMSSMVKRILSFFGITVLCLSGALEGRVYRAKTGMWEEIMPIPVPNLIVNVGIAYVANLLGDANGSSPTKFTHARIGSDNTAPANGDTDIKSILGTGQAVTPTKTTTTIANDTEIFTSTHTCTAPGGWTVVEYVLATAAAAGTILNRVVFAAINLALNDVLEFTYKVQVQR